MKNSVRTFIAIETSKAVRQRAAELIDVFRTAGVTASWVQPQNMHLTLKFLDEVPLREIHDVGKAVKEAAAGTPPFELEIRGTGAFPSPARPRTLWLGALEKGTGPICAQHPPGRSGKLDLSPFPTLGQLFADLETALGRLGFRKEPRRFEAHLTIGRVRSGGPAAEELGRLVQQHADFNAGQFEVTELLVFSSELTPAGPIYEVLCRAPLGVP